MSDIGDLKVLIGNLLPDNLNKAIKAKDARDAFDLVLNNLGNLKTQYLGDITPSSPAKTGVEEGATVLPTTDGVYPNFSNIRVENEICVLEYDGGKWIKKQVYSADMDILESRFTNDRTRTIDFIPGGVYLLNYPIANGETITFTTQAPVAGFQISFAAQKLNEDFFTFKNLIIDEAVEVFSYTFNEDYKDIRVFFSGSFSAGTAIFNMVTNTPAPLALNAKIDLNNKTRNDYNYDSRKSFIEEVEFDYEASSLHFLGYGVHEGETIFVNINTSTYGYLVTIAGELKNGSFVAIKQDAAVADGISYSWTAVEDYVDIRVAFSSLATAGTATVDVNIDTLANIPLSEAITEVKNGKSITTGGFKYTGGLTTTIPNIVLYSGEELKFTIDSGVDVLKGNIVFTREDGTTNQTITRDEVSGLTEHIFIAETNYTSLAWYSTGLTGSGSLDYVFELNFRDTTKNSRLVSKPVFNRGLTFEIDPPALPVLPPLSVDESTPYFYGLYDDLVTAFPEYVSKIDCDADSGINTPAYMAGHPIYMYKFSPYHAPSNSVEATVTSIADELKCFILSGIHPEYMGIFDLYQTMNLICTAWASNKNIEAMRYNSTFYIMPCAGPYGVDKGTRTNFNGVDLNRNAPTSDWRVEGFGTSTYSGPSAASEYETQVIVHYMEEINPQVFIDHHNFTSGANKNQMYVSTRMGEVINIGAESIEYISRKWKINYASHPPITDVITQFGWVQYTTNHGTWAVYGLDKGALSCTYESCDRINYDNGVLLPDNPSTKNTSEAVTQATDGFINFLCRILDLSTK